jgi:hypothetical protein
MGTVVPDRPMLRICDRPGCETFTLGLFCVLHEPEVIRVAFVRGRPHPRAADELPLQLLRLPRKTSA